MTTPTQRTLAECRRRGWMSAVVERWNPHAMIRQDLFGFVDIMAIGDIDCPGSPATLAIQVTSTGTAARKAKIDALPNVADLMRAGWFVEVWGWRMVNGRKAGKRKTYALKRERMRGPGDWELLEEEA